MEYGDTIVCTKCNIEKPIEEFGRRENGWRRKECKSCTKQLNKEYRAANLERLRRYDRERRPAGNEYRITYAKEYYKNNRKRLLAMVKEYGEVNKEYLKQKSKEYLQTHPEIRKAHQNNRDARRRKAGYKPLKPEQIATMFNEQSGRCFYCDIQLSKYHIDHIIPIKLGGKHELNNLVLACPKCNLSKNAQDPETFVNKILEVKNGSDTTSAIRQNTSR